MTPSLDPLDTQGLEALQEKREWGALPEKRCQLIRTKAYFQAWRSQFAIHAPASGPTIS